MELGVNQTLPRCAACDYDLCNECAEETLRVQAVNNMNAKDGAGGDKDCIGRMDSRVGVDASSGGSGQKKKKKKKKKTKKKEAEKGIFCLFVCGGW